MKLNFGRRLVLFVHWLLSLTLCGLMVAVIVWPECRETTIRLLNDRAVLIYAIAMAVVYLLFAAGAVAIILGGHHKDNDHAFIVVDSSETGRTRIAVVAVEQMIRQAVRGVNGIADMKASINNDTDAISIDVDAAILNGTHVPTVTANIQRAIRSYIELNCGVTVRGVSVSVHSLEDAEQTGRRGRRRNSASVNVEPVMNYSAPAQPESRDFLAEKPVMPEPIEEPAPAEALTQEPEAEETPEKKRFLKGLFGKRGEKAQEAAEPEPAETVEADAPAEETMFEEPATEESDEIVLTLGDTDASAEDEAEV